METPVEEQSQDMVNKEQQEETKKPEMKLVEIEFLGKDYYPLDIANGNVNEYISLDFKVKNLTDRDIAGVKAKITFLDVFGDEIITR